MEAGGKRWIVHGSRTDEFRIWWFSDLHWLNKACAEDRIRADVRKVQEDSHAFWFGGGDYCDYIGYSDKRFDPDCVADWVSVKDLGDLGQTGIKQVADVFRPIKHRCLGLLLGNHEKKYQLRTEHESLHGWLCTELGARNLQYCALTDVIFQRRTGIRTPRLQSRSESRGGDCFSVRVFGHHGAGYAQTPGGKLNRLVQFMQSFDAELFFCGHVHDHVARKEPVIGADRDCKELVERVKLGIVAGSYLKTYAQGTCTYAEQRGYRPTSLGAAVARIHPGTGQMSAMI